MKFVRYYILLGFIVLSISLFFVARLIAGIIYDYNETPADLLSQMTDAVVYALNFLGAYVLLLIILSLSGILWSRKKKNKEIYKGFIYSIVYCVMLLLVYLGVVVYMYII